MGFRRSKHTAIEAREWRRFLEINRDLLARTGVPYSIYESRDLFDDLLMHGYIDHHLDPTRFAVDQLGEQQRSLLADAIVRYLRAGFSNPGLGLFGNDIHEEIGRRAAEPA